LIQTTQTTQQQQTKQTKQNNSLLERLGAVEAWFSKADDLCSKLLHLRDLWVPLKYGFVASVALYHFKGYDEIQAQYIVDRTAYLDRIIKAYEDLCEARKAAGRSARRAAADPAVAAAEKVLDDAKKSAPERVAEAAKEARWLVAKKQLVLGAFKESDLFKALKAQVGEAAADGAASDGWRVVRSTIAPNFVLASHALYLPNGSNVAVSDKEWKGLSGSQHFIDALRDHRRRMGKVVVGVGSEGAEFADLWALQPLTAEGLHVSEFREALADAALALPRAAEARAKLLAAAAIDGWEAAKVGDQSRPKFRHPKYTANKYLDKQAIFKNLRSNGGSSSKRAQ
jgi:hypothetical protein